MSIGEALTEVIDNLSQEVARLRDELQAEREKVAELQKDNAEFNGWTSVDEKLPPKDTPVLCYEDGDIYKGAYKCLSLEDGDQYWESQCGQPVVYDPEPTHWMPIPSPPDQETKDNE